MPPNQQSRASDIPTGPATLKEGCYLLTATSRRTAHFTLMDRACMANVAVSFIRDDHIN